jgi:dTDP-glucose 4,6-dehydratase
MREIRRILVTGGAGFIGSHVIERLTSDWPDSSITILDKMTYAADYANISHLLERHQVRLVVGDICDAPLCVRLLEGVDVLVHLAAESHVDNSFGDSLQFTRSNTLGTHTLLEACRINATPLIIHVSTDEVYGEILSGEVDETAALNPTNPYSASKASAEMIVRGYQHSFKLPIVTVRANNIYGIRQYPEKLIPRCCLSIIRKDKIPIHGTGLYRRRFLAVQDFAAAISLLMKRGKPNDIFNVGSPEEYSNLEVVEMICVAFGVKSADHIQFVSNRPFNDQRYGISAHKIESLGWTRKYTLSKEIANIVVWYGDNADRYLHIPPFAPKEYLASLA